MAQKRDRRLGTIIGGKWRVDGLLGSGSMASVYAVTHRNGARAALKILHPTLCTDAKVCERFLGEGYLTNQVKHSGIVRVLDDGMTDDGCVFLVMDLLEGKTLEGVRQDRGGRIDVAEALDIADALMDALHAVHAAGIIHRDLKPQNVFLCEDGDVKLLDFGVARVLETSKSRSKMSLFGVVLGTPSFMSPEQAVGARDEVDHRADIYSLGATLFTALTGETVHLGPHVQAKLLAAGTVQARSISLVRQDLHPALVNVIDTALRFEKADRWQSVDAFRRALRDARRAAGLGDAAPVSIRSAPPESAAPSARPKRSRVVPPAKRSTKRPPPPAVGPTRTFAGIGPLAIAPAPSAPAPASPSVPPARRTLPYPLVESELPEHPQGHTGAAASLPVGILRAPGSGDVDAEEDDARDRAPSLADASYPAVGGTVGDGDTTALMSQLAPKRAGVGVWLAGLAALTTLGALALFLLGSPTASSSSSGADPTHDDHPAAAVPPTLTSASTEDMPAPNPTPSTMVVGDPLAADGGAGLDALRRPSATRTAAAPVGPTPPLRGSPLTAPPSWSRPARNPSSSLASPHPNSTNPTRSPAMPDPPPAMSPAPSAPAPASSDPFSTPE